MQSKFLLNIKNLSLMPLLLIIVVISCDTGNPLSNDIPLVVSGELLDSLAIAQLDEEITAGTYGEVHSLLIWKDDVLVTEKYYRGYNREVLHKCYSVTKSFTSALVGIAIDKGYILSTEEKLLSFFNDYEITNDKTSKELISLQDLLTMSPGFEWDEWSYSYNNPRNDVQKLLSSSDWIQYMLNLPLESLPGSKFLYNSGCTMLLSGILLNSTGMSAEEFARKNLFEHIDITRWTWEEGPKNITNTGWGLSLKPIDMLKLGRLFLNNGKFNGEQIISKDWIEQSTKMRMKISYNSDYAYQWWCYSEYSSTAGVLRKNDVYYANGWGNQYIFVIPHLNMVVVTTAGNYDNEKSSNPMMREYILPAAYAIE